MKVPDQDALSMPFTDDQIEWRVMRCGVKNSKTWAQLAAYVDARAIMNRLDAVMGLENWQTKFREIQTPNGAGILCTLSLYIDGRWISKEDGADFSRGIEITKSGISDSLKRTAVQWGIGRYLYTLPTVWADNIQDGYPPRGTDGILISKKEPKIQAWCPRPQIDAMLPASKKPRSKDDLIFEVKRLIVNLNLKHRAASLRKHLKVDDVKDLAQCSEKALENYIKGLRNLPATTQPASKEGEALTPSLEDIRKLIEERGSDLPSDELQKIQYLLEEVDPKDWTASGIKEEYDKLTALLVA